jgi:hypothetical protein
MHFRLVPAARRDAPPWGDILARRDSAEQVAAGDREGTTRRLTSANAYRIMAIDTTASTPPAATAWAPHDECGAGIGEPSAAHVGGDELAGVDEVSDDVVGAALGDADHGGDAPEARAGAVGNAQQRPGVVGEEALTSRGLTL